MITPKKSFANSKYGKEWNSLVNSSQFETAAQAALAQMEIDLGYGSDLQSAASGHFQMHGAKRFLATLMGLCKAEPERPLHKSDNLTHR